MIRKIQAVGILIGLWMLVSSFRHAWTDLATHPLVVSWPRILLATGLLVVTYGGFAWLWRAIAKELGTVVPYSVTVQFWSLSNLGRYVPGKVWQITGVMLVAADLGVSPGLAATIGVLALGFSVATGGLVGFVLVPELFPSDQLRIGAAAVSALTLAVPIAFPGLLRDAMQRLPRFLGCSNLTRLSRWATVRLVTYFVAGWLIHGTVFQVFCSAFTPVSWDRLGGVIGAYCLSYVTGLVAVFAPAGIGVREELLGTTLGAVLPGAPVHLIAVAARVWTMAAEMVVLVVALVLRVRSLRRRPAAD